MYNLAGMARLLHDLMVRVGGRLRRRGRDRLRDVVDGHVSANDRLLVLRERRAHADHGAARHFRDAGLAEIGDQQDIKVTDDEVSRAMMDRLKQFPGQEQLVYDYYQKNPEALAELRAPIFEDKVVDYILELAKVSEKKMSSEELFANDESSD